jgi:archaellum biogenesis ATPase FlaH
MLPKVTCYCFDYKNKRATLLTLSKLFWEAELLLNYSFTVINKVSNMSNIMASIEPCIQICLQNPIIVCNADQVLQHRAERTKIRM